MLKQIAFAALTIASIFETAHAQQIEPAWSFYPGFFAPGVNGAAIVDLDDDGLSEAVVTGSMGNGFGPGNMFAIVESRNGSLRVTRAVPLRNQEELVGRMQVLPATDSSPLRMVVLTNYQNSTRMNTFAGPDMERVGEVTVPSDFIMNQMADVDADGSLEVLGHSGGPWGGAPMILDATTGAVEWQEVGTDANAIGAGQLDQDAALEIVIGNQNSGIPGRILDGATHAEEWTYFGGFRGTPVFGNFDGNLATSEFAIIEPWGFTRIFTSTPIYSPISEFETGEAGTFLAQDLNADGVTDITIGEGQWGSVVAYSPDTWTTIFNHANPEHGVTGIAVGQLDADASPEVLFGAGWTSTGSDLLRVFDLQTNAIEFDQIDDSGPHSSVLVDDFDGDGSLEVAMATLESASGYEGAMLRIANAQTGEVLRSMHNLVEPWGTNYGAQLFSTNLDGDPQMEIVAAGGYLYDAYIRAIDSTTLETQWEFVSSAVGDVFGSTSLMDYNHDAYSDIVGVTNQRVVIVSGADGSLLWQSVTLGPFYTGTSVVAANADNDPATEILVSNDNLVLMLDAESHLLERQFTVAAPVIGLSVEGNDDSCRIVVFFDSSLQRRRCDTNVVDSTRAYATGPVNFVRAVQDSAGPLVLADDQFVMLQDDSNIVATSSNIGPQLGWNNRGAVIQDGDTTSVFVGGLISVNRVDFRGDLIFQHGFE
ncbi:MAG: hypothetical protein E6Q99_04020 [Elusimicrobia bacterium]|nr:MAG: hypothetical protein E6Q99_04020 [Elusimicrobiota bacterium]